MNLLEIENSKQFETEKYVPHKSPYQVFINLSPFITGKSYFEIGCGYGHCLNYVNEHLQPLNVSGCENRSQLTNDSNSKWFKLP